MVYTTTVVFVQLSAYGRARRQGQGLGRLAHLNRTRELFIIELTSAAICWHYCSNTADERVVSSMYDNGSQTLDTHINVPQLYAWKSGEITALFSIWVSDSICLVRGKLLTDLSSHDAREYRYIYEYMNFWWVRHRDNNSSAALQLSIHISITIEAIIYIHLYFVKWPWTNNNHKKLWRKKL